MSKVTQNKPLFLGKTNERMLIEFKKIGKFGSDVFLGWVDEVCKVGVQQSLIWLNTFLPVEHKDLFDQVKKRRFGIILFQY